MPSPAALYIQSLHTNWCLQTHEKDRSNSLGINWIMKNWKSVPAINDYVKVLGDWPMRTIDNFHENLSFCERYSLKRTISEAAE